MACFNLQIGDHTYKFINDDSSLGESKNSLRGWDSFIAFLNTGDLQGGRLFDESGNIITDISSFFDSSIETLRSCRDTYMNLETGQKGVTASGTWLINNIVGNHSFGNYGQNVFTNKNWGQTVWYGFSNRRGVIVGGFFNKQHASLLFRLYEDIKNSNTNAHLLIEKIYGKYHDDKKKTNIYEQLTWVANTCLDELLPSIDIIYGDNYYVKKNIRKVRSDIRKADNIEYFRGQYIMSNGVPYIILGKKSETDDHVKVVSMDGSTQSIEVDSISKIGRTRTLTYQGNTYFKINNSWYRQVSTKSKTAYIKIESFKEIKDLNKVFLGLSDFKVFDWRRTEERLYLDKLTKKAQKQLQNLARFEGIVLQTNVGTYESNGSAFVNSSGIELDIKTGPRVEMIYIPKNILPDIATQYQDLLSKIEPPIKELTFSYTQIRLGLYELCGITDHTTIQKDFNLRSPVQINKSQNGLVLKINGNYKTKYNSKFITEVLNAGKFFKFASENQEELFKLMGDISFNRLYRMWNEGKLKEELPQVYEYVVENFRDVGGNPVTPVSDDLSGKLQEVIENNNVEEIRQKMGKGRLDDIIKTLIHKGLYIYSCEL